MSLSSIIRIITLAFTYRNELKSLKNDAKALYKNLGKFVDKTKEKRKQIHVEFSKLEDQMLDNATQMEEAQHIQAMLREMAE